jgi:hypothetical protein
MRASMNAIALIVLLVSAFSCGGDQEPDTAEVTSEEIETAAEVPLTDEPVADTEMPQDTVETALVSAGPDGEWNSTMGQLVLSADESGNITGEYPLGSIEGTLSGNILEFTYTEGSLSGAGEFTFAEDFNSFTGFQDISGTELLWDGSRL